MRWQTKQEEGGRGSAGFGHENNRMVLDEKYFRRVERFEGDVSKFRGWLFDLMVPLGQVDQDLGREVQRVLSAGTGEKSADKWDPIDDGGVDLGIYTKFASELYGLLVSLTSGEAKSILKGMVDAGGGMDGFKGIMVLSSRFDTKTSASLLH